MKGWIRMNTQKSYKLMIAGKGWEIRMLLKSLMILKGKDAKLSDIFPVKDSTL